MPLSIFGSFRCLILLYLCIFRQIENIKGDNSRQMFLRQSVLLHTTDVYVINLYTALNILGNMTETCTERKNKLKQFTNKVNSFTFVSCHFKVDAYIYIYICVCTIDCLSQFGLCQCIVCPLIYVSDSSNVYFSVLIDIRDNVFFFKEITINKF